MSYEKIKSISFKNNEIKITSYSSNVTPIFLETWISRSLTEILKKNGKEEVIKEILLSFWKRSFQGNSTKYGKFIEVYKFNNTKYDWDNVGNLEKIGTESILYSYEEVKDDLYDKFLKYQSLKSIKDNFLVKLNYNFISKLRRNGASITSYKDCAQKFTATQIETIKNRFSQSIIEVIKVTG